jgi:putative phosphoribosyl transferase
MAPAERRPVVLGLARGGVVVAYEVARALSALLDVWVVRKVGTPGHEELGLGAIAEGGATYLNEELMAELGVSPGDVADLYARKAAEVDARVERYRQGRPPPEIEGRTVIVVDDGIATGGTMRAALRAIRARGPRRLVLAVPVGALHTLASMRPDADEVVCLYADPYLSSIGAYYDDFRQTTDEDVMDLLERARAEAGGDRKAARARQASQAVDIEVDGATLEGTLTIPEEAVGLVLFAHGSGSSRHSPRNRYVAGVLQRARLGTLLLDLLTADEEARDEAGARLRFDVELLAKRVREAAEATLGAPETTQLPLGYFGASTGAAAALIAAAEAPELVSAVVSRGGRPDLAWPYLPRVAAPTLLIVGAADTEVLALNRSALERLECPRDLAIVPGATHLFEEPGTLDEVARLATAWFQRHLAAGSMRATG